MSTCQIAIALSPTSFLFYWAREGPRDVFALFRPFSGALYYAQSLICRSIFGWSGKGHWPVFRLLGQLERFATQPDV